MLGKWRQTRPEEEARAELGALFDQYSPGLLAYAAGLLSSHEDAEEVLQEAFARYFSVLLQGKPATTPEAYLYRSTRNLAYSRLRRRRLFGRLLRESPAQSSWLRPLNGTAPHPPLLVESALAALPARQREVVTLKVFEGRTFGEIARLLNISPNTAASRYRYALEKLRPLLEEHADAP